jgi:hypothetical protein
MKMKKIGRIIEVAYIAVCLMVMSGVYAGAYMDPSVTTYAVQAIAGVAVAAGAFAAIYWRKARRKINEKLGVDENSKKEFEDDVVESAETDNDELNNKNGSD